MLILAVILSIITAMAGSSRTLYQGAADGWLPNNLSHVNEHGAPTPAMWTNLGFNLLLLLMSDYVFVLAVSNCCYIFFNFLNLHAGWIHRIDNGHIERPWRAPNWVLGAGAVLAFVNVFLLGAGAKIYGNATVIAGIIAAFLVVPLFLYRHYVSDKGKFREQMLAEQALSPFDLAEGRKAGILPYMTLLAGAAVILVTALVFS